LTEALSKVSPVIDFALNRGASPPEPGKARALELDNNNTRRENCMNSSYGVPDFHIAPPYGYGR
jgi:hypothetical protein